MSAPTVQEFFDLEARMPESPAIGPALATLRGITFGSTSDDPRVSVMAALELVLDVAYHDGTSRDLAVASEAWLLAGYTAWTFDISHSGHRDDLLACVERARRGRPRRILRADARGLLAGLTALAHGGAITYSSCAEANRQRWVARGGHARTGGA